MNDAAASPPPPVGQKSGKVLPLIEKATNSTSPEIDPRLLKSIKLTVRSSDSELRLAAQTLIDLMSRSHSQVRLLALLIIDELFMRSKLFRTIIVPNFDQLLSLSIGFRRQSPLPLPSAVATLLRSRAIEFLEKWNDSFGVHYRQIRLGFEYLKNTLRYHFPNLRENAARVMRERQEREARTQEILRSKFVALRESFESVKDETRVTVEEVRECLRVLRSEDEETSLITEGFDDEEYEVYRSRELEQIRIDSLKEAGKVKESSQNKVVFDALRELYKLLVTKHLVTVQESLSVLMRAEVEDTRFRDAALKEFIDIRNSILAEKKKCEESGCSLPDLSTDDEDVVWEEGNIGPHGTDNSSMQVERKDDLASMSGTKEIQRKDASRLDSKNSKGKAKLYNEDHGYTDEDSTSLRSKLLADAPVVNWGSFLDHWGSKSDVLANQRGLELDGHWGRVDYDAVIPADKIAELNVQATIYKEEQADIEPCRAPLRSGKLCQRRDLRVCPFHGPVVPRDDQGNPIEPLDAKSSSMGSPDPDMKSVKQRPLPEQEMSFESMDAQVKHLAKQAIKNVRERDKEEAGKREEDRQQLKRAKLAKVREHNEAVLREAAMASTSRSTAIGDYLDTIDAVRASAKAKPKNKKPTLASMLRKKVTPKDRLDQRLLSNHARDATSGQVCKGDDLKYRESFPNQW
ncbi:hypothetical protein Droror1_Dr00000662 [Drosera rotundifolia]